MSCLKKMFYGIFDAPVFQGFKTKVESDLDILKAKPGTDTLDAKLMALGSTMGILFQLTPMAVWGLSQSGVQNDVISVPFMVRLSEIKEFEAFGLQADFDPAYFSFVGVKKGSLTGAWVAVSANEDVAGHLIIGGYVGDTINLNEHEKGSIFYADFQVLGTSGESNITFRTYIDGLQGFLPDPLIINFKHGE